MSDHHPPFAHQSASPSPPSHSQHRSPPPPPPLSSASTAPSHLSSRSASLSSPQNAAYPTFPPPAAVRDQHARHSLHYSQQHVKQPYRQLPPSSRQSVHSSGSRASSNRQSRDSARFPRSPRWHSDSSPDSLQGVYDEEKDICVVPAPISRRSPVLQRDLEKEYIDPPSSSSHASHASLHQTGTYDDDDEDGEDEDDIEHDASHSRSNTFKALSHLAFLNPFLSAILMFYTLGVLLVSLLSLPLRLVTKPKMSVSASLASRLAKATALNLRCVCRKPIKRRSGEASEGLKSTGAGSATATLLLAPLVSFPYLAAAWAIGMFWIFNALINDEGSGRGDGQGMSCTLIEWWVWWCEGRAFGG